MYQRKKTLDCCHCKCLFKPESREDNDCFEAKFCQTGWRVVISRKKYHSHFYSQEKQILVKTQWIRSVCFDFGNLTRKIWLKCLRSLLGFAEDLIPRNQMTYQNPRNLLMKWKSPVNPPAIPSVMRLKLNPKEVWKSKPIGKELCENCRPILPAMAREMIIVHPYPLLVQEYQWKNRLGYLSNKPCVNPGADIWASTWTRFLNN